MNKEPMMKRNLQHALQLTAVVWAICCAASALAAPVEPSWTIYTPGNTGVPGDYTRDIFVDGEGKPWIPGFIPFWEQGGMARFDHETNTWFVVSNVDYPVIASPRFNDIDSDADGIMWIGTNEGLLRYNPAVGPSSLVRFDEFNSPMPGDQVQQVSIAPDGSIWLAIHNVADPPPGGLVRFDPVSETWNVWTTANGLPWSAQWPGWDGIDYAAAAPDDDGGYTVYFGSMEMGAASYKDGVFTWFQANPTVPMIWGTGSDDPVDDLGHLWLSTEQGLARRDPDGSITVVGSPAPGAVEAFSGGRAGLRTSGGDVWLYDDGWTYHGNWGGGSTKALAEESPGVLWVGGNGGAARYENGNWQRYRLTNTGMIGYSVETITFDAAGNVYINGNAAPGVGGYEIFDGERWTCVDDLNYGLGPPWGLPSDNASALCVRANGNLALAPSGLQGVLEWDGFSYTYRLPQGYSIDFVVEDGLGRLWATADYGSAFLLHDEGGWTQWSQGSSPLPVGYIGALIADEVTPGYVWIAAQLGVAHTNGVDWIVYPDSLLGLDQTIRCVEVADDGTLWVGSDEALVHFDPVTLHSTTYTTVNTTLPSNEIDHLTIAPDGSIWMSTFDSVYPYPGGLTRFDGETWTTWTKDDSPLPHNQIYDLESRAVAGGYEVWVGTAGDGVAVLTISTAAPGDLDDNGVVDISDLLALLAAWGACPPPCAADLDGDGVVGITDLLILLANWG
jgi:ligand-binding sensor domain-containing protein